jgi:hypothetical protein
VAYSQEATLAGTACAISLGSVMLNCRVHRTMALRQDVWDWTVHAWRRAGDLFKQAAFEGKQRGAAASLREGLKEMLTPKARGITGALRRALRTTHPIENLNGSVARYCRKVKRQDDRQMVLRWAVQRGLLGAMPPVVGRWGCGGPRGARRLSRRPTAGDLDTVGVRRPPGPHSVAHAAQRAYPPRG